MQAAPKRILIVASNRPLRESRGMLLENAGYTVVAVGSDNEGMALLETERFDLVLLGRNFRICEKDLDQRMRERHPDLLILKISDRFSVYPTRITDSLPVHVLAALKEMLN